MANESLVISISADQKAALAGLKQLNDQLLQLEKALKKTSDTAGIIKLQDQIRSLKAEMSSLNEVAQGKLVKGTNQAANALTNLGRVAQDAPYGFIGIQNNLNPLLESFQRLKAETGSTGTALKALGAGLMGPAGLGIALSVGSALLVTFGDKLFSVSSEALKAQKSHEDFTKSMSDATGQAKSEELQLNTLLAIVNDTTQSTNNRKRALDQLKGSYEGNLELQRIDINDGDKLVAVIGKITEAITRKARAEVFAKLIAEEEAKVAKIQMSNVEDATKAVDGWTKSWVYFKSALLSTSPLLAVNEANTGMLSEGFKELNQQTIGATKNIKTYTDLLNKNTVAQIENNDSRTLSTAAPKKEKEKITKPIDQKKFASKMQQLENESMNLKALPPEIAKTQKEETTGAAGDPAYWANLTQQRKLLNEQMMISNDLAAQGAAVFGDMAIAMLNGQNIGDVLAESFKRLVAQLVEAVAKALIFKALMTVITGGGSLAASGAAGAIGGAAGGAAGGGGGLFGSLFGFLSGNNILMGQNRTRTSMGLKRGG